MSDVESELAAAERIRLDACRTGQAGNMHRERSMLALMGHIIVALRKVQEAIESLEEDLKALAKSVDDMADLVCPDPEALPDLIGAALK